MRILLFCLLVDMRRGVQARIRAAKLFWFRVQLFILMAQAALPRETFAEAYERRRPR